MNLCQVIPDRFEYRPGATYVGSTINDLLTVGGAVCQDIAHLSLVLLRHHGIAARYVSGYLFSTGGQGDDPLAGSGTESVEVATHAWIEAPFRAAMAVASRAGWASTQPTAAGVEAHVKIGHGRHYNDVPPTKGVNFGAATSDLEATVTMTRLNPGRRALAHNQRRAPNTPALPTPRPARSGRRSAVVVRSACLALGVHATERFGLAGALTLGAALVEELLPSLELADGSVDERDDHDEPDDDGKNGAHAPTYAYPRPQRTRAARRRPARRSKRSVRAPNGRSATSATGRGSRRRSGRPFRHRDASNRAATSSLHATPTLFSSLCR